MRQINIGDWKIQVGRRKDRPGAVQVTVRDGDDRRRRRSFRSEAEAQAWVEELRAELASVGVVAERDLLEMVEGFLADRAAMDLQPKTLEHNREMLNAAIAHWGANCKVAKLATVEELKAFSVSRKTQVSDATRRHELRIIGQALRWAKARAWISEVPPIQLPKQPEPRQEWLRSNEIAPFLDGCGATFRGVAEAAIYFGLREAEVCHAQAGDFDLASGILWVRAKPELGWQPKNGRARGIPLIGRGADMASEIARRPSGAWAWPSRHGTKRTTCSWFAKATKRAAEAAGITRDLVYHDLRRTFGALMIEAGASMRAVQLALGHQSIRTTERVYAPVTQQFLATEMAKMDELLKRRGVEHQALEPRLRVVR